MRNRPALQCLKARNHGSVWLRLLLFIAFVFVLGFAFQSYKRSTSRSASEKQLVEAGGEKLRDQVTRQEGTRKSESAQQESRISAADEERKSLELEASEILRSLESLNSMFKRWTSYMSTASTTIDHSNEVLFYHMQRLEKIKEETEALSVAPCLETAKRKLASGMGMTIHSTIMLKANTINGLKGLEEAKAEIDDYLAEMRSCKTKVEQFVVRYGRVNN